MDFSKFDKEMDKEQIAADIAKAKENGTGDFKEVPKGKYTCEIENLELGETKNGEPMFKAMFRIVEGEFKKSCLFFNRKIYGNKANATGTWNDGVAINGVLGWLSKLGCDFEIEFDSYSQFADLCDDIAEDVVGNTQCEVDYDPEAFNNISVKEVWDK